MKSSGSQVKLHTGRSKNAKKRPWGRSISISSSHLMEPTTNPRIPFTDKVGDIVISHHALPPLKKDNINSAINDAGYLMSLKRLNPGILQSYMISEIARKGKLEDSDGKENNIKNLNPFLSYAGSQVNIHTGETKNAKKRPLSRSISISSPHLIGPTRNPRVPFIDEDGDIVISHHALPPLKKKNTNSANDAGYLMSLNRLNSGIIQSKMISEIAQKRKIEESADKEINIKNLNPFLSSEVNLHTGETKNAKKRPWSRSISISSPHLIGPTRNPRVPFTDKDGDIVISHHALPPLKKNNINSAINHAGYLMSLKRLNSGISQPKIISKNAWKRKLKDSDPTHKKNLVEFMDHNGKVIATLRNPLSWNSANVTLSKLDDRRRYVSELHSMGITKRDNIIRDGMYI